MKLLAFFMTLLSLALSAIALELNIIFFVVYGIVVASLMVSLIVCLEVDERANKKKTF